ncbi:MAG: Rpn family recombination-promoting nuclease/putative transposase [Armatimonadetes bacterium]|nr:Rpn family recombination-promoting nuclease/putative transposase [Armatimonadota bacterium]
MTQQDDAPVREFADRGTIWLLGSPANLRDLVAMAAKDIADSLEFSRAERVNRSFVPANLHKQEADLLYRVPFRAGRAEVWVYVLVEHQSQPDRLMSLRLLSYMVQVWDLQREAWDRDHMPAVQRRPAPIVPIVFYTGTRRWRRVSDLASIIEAPRPLQRFVPRFDTLFVNLAGLGTEELKGSALGSVLRALQVAHASAEELQEALVTAMHELGKLPAEDRAEWRRAAHYLLLLVRHLRKPSERECLYQALSDGAAPEQREEFDEMAMTDAQVLLAQGRREGIHEGIQEGCRRLLSRLLERRFGPLTTHQRRAVEALTEAEAETMSDRLLDARSPADLGL